MSKYKYEGYGVIRDLKDDISYHTDDIVDLLEEKDIHIKKLEEENQQLKQSQKQLVSDALRKLEYSVVDISNGYWCYFNSTGDAYMTSHDLGNCLEEFIKNQIKGA